MKKRIICLLLSALMVLFCFASCGKKTEAEVKEKIGEKASEEAVTLSMYLMSEEPVSEKQELLMESKVNEITESKFRVRLDLKYFTPDQYYTKLEADLAQMSEFYANHTGIRDKGTPVYTDENGLPSIYYPRIEEFDVDMFYFGGYDKYCQYKKSGYLADLGEEINGASKALKSGINSTLLTQLNSVSGGYFAVPTNRKIGEYTYLLLNKDVLKATQYKASDITSLACENCQDMLGLVAENMSDRYVPIYSSTGELDVLGVKYYGVAENGLEANGFSIIGGTTGTNWKWGEFLSYPGFGNIMASPDRGNLAFSDQTDVLKGYQFKGYYSNDTEKPFAVGYVKGGVEIVDQYSRDYEVIPVAMPTVTHDDLYSDMFGVTANSNSIKQSMEVLTHLNTDAEFKNLLLYGVEGENYTWVDSDVADQNGNFYRVISRQTKDADKIYAMDTRKTGNVALAYPAVGEDPRAAEFLIKQNADLKVDYVIGFSIYDGVQSGEISTEAFKALRTLNEKSTQIYEKIKAANNQEGWNAVKSEINSQLINSPELSLVLSKTDKSPLAYFIKYLERKGLDKSSLQGGTL